MLFEIGTTHGLPMAVPFILKQSKLVPKNFFVLNCFIGNVLGVFLVEREAAIMIR